MLFFIIKARIIYNPIVTMILYSTVFFGTLYIILNILYPVFWIRRNIFAVYLIKEYSGFYWYWHKRRICIPLYSRINCISPYSSVFHPFIKIFIPRIQLCFTQRRVNVDEIFNKYYFFICQYVQVSHNYVYYKTISRKLYCQIYLEEAWTRYDGSIKSLEKLQTKYGKVVANIKNFKTWKKSIWYQRL